jgi:hypothetical protein
MPGAPAAGRPAAAQPVRPDIARQGARAVHRELSDPRHPMARLLAAAGDTGQRPADKERQTREEFEPAEAARPVAYEPPRPVHVAEPEPAAEAEAAADEPATLEALAARFGQRRPPAAGARPAGKASSERSRQEREKQAAILAKLRQDAARYQK